MARKNKSSLVAQQDVNNNSIEEIIDGFGPSPLSDVPISIVCPFCSISFRSTPLLLSCGHSLCETCIGDFRWKLRWLLSKPKCPICLEETGTIKKNFILDEVVEKLSKENRSKKIFYSSDDSEITTKLKKEIERIGKRNDDLEVEIVTWHELQDLKQKEVDDFRENNPDELLDGSSLFYLFLTFLALFLIYVIFGNYLRLKYRPVYI